MSYEDLLLGVLDNDAKRVRAAIQNGKQLDGNIGTGYFGGYYFTYGTRGFTTTTTTTTRTRLMPFVGAKLPWIAAFLGHSLVLSILLESGAPRNGIKDGKTALQIAKFHNHSDCVALLESAEAEAKKETAIKQSAEAEAKKETAIKQTLQEAKDAQRARICGLDGTTLATVPREAFDDPVQITVQGINLSASVDQKSCLTLSLTTMGAGDRGARSKEAVAAHRDKILKREEDLEFKLAEAAEIQAAAQRAEDVDWQEFAQIQAVIGKHRTEIKALKAQKKVSFGFEEIRQVISLTAKPREVHMPSPLVRVPFVWVPPGSVSIECGPIPLTAETDL